MTSHLLSELQLEQFKNQGFLLVKNFFTKEDLQLVIKSIEELVDSLANELYEAKLIPEKYEKEGFYTRLTCMEKAYPGAAVLMHTKGILTDAMAALWTDPRLLDVAQQILGKDICGHPVWNLRTKTPSNSQATVPWHQDTAYLTPGSEKTLQLTAWIPLLDTNKENGCMEVISGAGMKNGMVLDHECCNDNSWYISIKETEFSKLPTGITPVLCPVPFGGVLFIDQLIPHRSLENYSNQIRWSLDLRWQGTFEPHGYWTGKSPVVFRSSKDPNYKIEWGDWKQVSRTKLDLQKLIGQNEDLRFTAIIAGPWMERWPITHHNKHTRSMNK